MSDAMQRLLDGNERFVQGRSAIDWEELARVRIRTAGGQSPFAVVLTCADSRVPAEMIFDQGVGDLFVVRVAGNVVTPAVIGSVEFAVGVLGSEVVVTMGHAACGAVGAAVDQKLAPTADLTDGLQAIVDDITPAVDAVIDARAGENDGSPEYREEIVAAAVREHARLGASSLLARSPLLAEHASRDAIRVVSAEYDLESGRVTFL